jgi:hypothetical protein
MVDAVVARLTPDLLRPEWRGRSHPLAGHCYVASEALYHLRGRVDTPMHVRHEGASHWFLRTLDGQVLDVTAAQFETPVPYEAARGKGFLTREPSMRARTLIERVLG